MAAVLELSEQERGAWLSEQSAAIRDEVESLLAAYCRAGDFLGQETAGQTAAPDLTGRIDAIMAWSKGAVAAADSAPSQAGSPMALGAGAQLGPYRIECLLGKGGMGEVFRGTDTRLGRPVAIKVSAQEFSERFEREARTISALNHPHICTLYDVGTLPSGSRYLVTELVEGESLSDWLKRSPESKQCVAIAEQVLEALRAAHGAGILHRDLKPANIMVRTDGYAKVLDFGLAKRIRALTSADTTASLSVPGQIVGTIRYMSPEQIRGLELDVRSDLFAFGIVFYEMLAGRHPWPCASGIDTMHAIIHDDPPPIDSPWAEVAFKLLSKNREDRYASADAVLQSLASPTPLGRRRARSLTRLIVLPFRVLRQHETADFLSISLPDAITSSLAALDSLVVRSTMAATRFAESPGLDIRAVAEQAQVDAILTGTILSDGETFRVSTQLIEAPSAAVLWSGTSQVSVRDIFQLQDELVDRIVDSLALPLSTDEQRALTNDVPASATAYEWYLRANQIAGGGMANLINARDLYLRCVNLDPNYAPAWARLGRAYRILGKFDPGDSENFTRADEAFKKAFTLNPELALAHNFYTVLESDLGRSLDSVERLLKRARTHRNDPNLFAGLVQSCRYCDLLPASVAAHERAHQLDPLVPTSVAWTYRSLQDFQAVLDSSGAWDGLAWVSAMVGLGRRTEAIERLRELEISSPRKEKVPYALMWRAYLEGDLKNAVAALERAMELVPFHKRDPEARFIRAEDFAMLREPDRALEHLSLALDEGYRCHYALVHHREWDSLREHPQFKMLTDRAVEMSRYAQTLFLDNGGNRLLGVPRSTS
ncbi:MAG: protein kinase domain-containing protein [Bryobacteraceae bacterium]